MLIKGIRTVLESEWIVPIVFLFAMLGQIFNFINYSLPIIVGVVVLLLLFCKDVKNVMAIILYAPFYINNIFLDPREKLFTIAVIVAIFSLVVAVAVRIIKGFKQKTFKKGELYLPLFATFTAYLLGGIFFNFDAVRFLTIIMFCSASLLFYFLAVNSTKDLTRFMYKTFVWGALMVSLEMFIGNVKAGGWANVFTRYVIDIGAENINVAALFLLLGVCGAFGLGYKKQSDGAFFVLAVFFALAIVVSRCRMITFLTAVTVVAFAIISFVDSPNKKGYALTLVLFFSMISVIAVSFGDEMIEILLGFTVKEGLSGRDRLWAWCFEQFKKYPVFGIGFIYPESIPGLDGQAAKYVLAHNTLVQWIASLGIVGTLLMFYFVYTKYKIMSKNINVEFILRFTLVLIALSGIVDQAAQMDPFILNITIIMIASLENLERNDEKDRYIKTYGFKRIITEANLKK